MKILSFIIPAYNSRDFLEKCVSSMIVPEVRDCLEILIVNDGSTDDTAAIAECLRLQYPDVIRVLSQENRGHGGAINTGCAAARGRYLKVIDADDWVNTQSLDAYVDHLKVCTSDVVLTHHHTVNIQTGKTTCWKSYPPVFGKPISLGEINVHWLDFARSMRFHGITYRTDFYRKHTPGMPERVFYEDNFYATYPCCYAKTLEVLDLFLYEYRIGDAEQSVSEINQIRRIDQMECVLLSMARQRAILQDENAGVYAEKKLEELLLIYLKLALLVHPDRQYGRSLARKVMAMIGDLVPGLYAAVKNRYRVFCLLHHLHIKQNQVDALFASGFYKRLRGHRLNEE